jgi:hypothetical protein
VVPSSGIVNIFGDGVDINTTGSGNTIRVNLDADVATAYPTNSGTAIPSSHQLHVIGGSNINTSGFGNNVIINLDTDVTIPGDLVVTGSTTLNGTATISSFSEGVVQSDLTGQLFSDKGTNGQILIGSTAGAPAWANITSTGATVTITNNANSINLETAGGGGGNTIISQFTSSGTWTKNVATQYIEIHGWNAGGGGAGGGLGGSNPVGGGSGGSYGYFTFQGPEFCFPALEAITIGAGGTGGLGRSLGGAPNPGANGGITTFGVLSTTSASASLVIGGPASGGGLNTFANSFLGGAGYLGEYLSEGICFQDQQNGANGSTSNLQLSNNPVLSTNAYGNGGGAAQTSGFNGREGRPGGSSRTFPNTQGGIVVSNRSSLYRMPTNGGGGAGYNSAAPAAFVGGDGGSMLAPDSSVLIAGGTGGVVAGPQDGGNGNAGLGPVGVMCGGTGGGGGSSEFTSTAAGNGGNGGFPGGGGGGGGAGVSMPSGSGGDGADGLVIVIEYL